MSLEPRRLRRRAMLDAALERGCEIVAHNYEQGELLTDYAKDPERERELIRRTLEVYEQAVGRKARPFDPVEMSGGARREPSMVPNASCRRTPPRCSLHQSARTR